MSVRLNNEEMEEISNGIVKLLGLVYSGFCKFFPFTQIKTNEKQ